LQEANSVAYKLVNSTASKFNKWHQPVIKAIKILTKEEGDVTLQTMLGTDQELVYAILL
jgi:hypothetical protein